jgi:polyisoprenoid-binding protein YceI
MALVISCVFSSVVVAAPDKYTLDPQHSFVLWHIKHFDFSNQSGKFYANGTLMLDDANPKNSKVDVTIQVNDMVTGIDKLDEHLKGKSFFDVSAFPTATFVSNKVDVTGKDTAKVHGMLTLHGVTKPVVLSVKLNRKAMNPISEKETAGFSATAKIKRSDFGMTTLIPKLGDQVDLNIEVEANLEKK